MNRKILLILMVAILGAFGMEAATPKKRAAKPRTSASATSKHNAGTRVFKGTLDFSFDGEFAAKLNGTITLYANIMVSKIIIKK